jgi:hypothetical protein
MLQQAQVEAVSSSYSLGRKAKGEEAEFSLHHSALGPGSTFGGSQVQTENLFFLRPNFVALERKYVKKSPFPSNFHFCVDFSERFEWSCVKKISSNVFFCILDLRVFSSGVHNLFFPLVLWF